MADSSFSMPDNLSELTPDELATLKSQLEEAGAAIVNKTDAHTAADLAQLTELGKHLTAVKSEGANREQQAAEYAAAIDAFRGEHLAPAPAADAGTAPAAPAAPAVAPAPAADPVPAGDLVTAGAGGTPQRGKTPAEDLLRDQTLNVNLRRAARGAIRPVAATDDDFILTASANVYGREAGSRYESRDELVEALHHTARNMGVSRSGNGIAPDYRPVGTARNHFSHILHERSSQEEVEAALRVLTDPKQLYAMDDDGNIDTAGGGFCSPSLRRYDFFNLTCEDGEIDLPTFGVERGGTSFPVSPSLADVFTGAFTSGTNPWLWTETDDIATVTGAPNKPCVRVPCPSFNDVRLECYGICLTAGNLTDSAYPEATRNQIRLLMSALHHAKNARYIQQMQTLASTLVTGGVAGSGWVSPTLSMLELFAEDYRTRYGMCQDAPMEVALPHWWLGGARADLSRRNGYDGLSATNRYLADRFDERFLRVQFVSDYQVRTGGLPGAAAASPTLWPTSVEFMMWPAGTVVRGNGLSLNLGVVRDSVLNAENDHTALWMEECHLIAKVGHEIKRGSVLLCADGTTGAADLTNCL